MALPMLSSQDNEVTYLVPWLHLQKPPKEGGKPRPHRVNIRASSLMCELTSPVFQVCTNWFPSRCALEVQQYGAKTFRLPSVPMMHQGTARFWGRSITSLGP